MAPPIQRLLLVLLALALTACATVIQPNLGPDIIARQAYDAAPTLSNAIALGTSMRDRYLDKIESQVAWERGVGVGLIGAATIAADLAIRGVGSSEVLGLGLAGAALYTGNNWLFSKPQQMIYAAGASAVQCALDVMQPWQLANASRPDLRANVARIALATAEIENVLATRTGRPPTPAETIARSAVERAHAVLPPAKELLNAFDGAAVALRSSLMAIQFQVTNAYLANSPSIQGLVDQLGKSLPATGSKIIGVSLPSVAESKNTSAVGGQDELAGKAKVLNALVSAVAESIVTVDIHPNEDKLKLCNVDLRQAGLAMKHSPPGALAVQPGGAATVVVSGGVLPYRAEWIGTRPPDGVALKIESGQGFVTVEARAGTKPGKYQLLVLDAGPSRDAIEVAIGDGGGATPSPASPVVKPVSSASAPKTRVQKVQQALIAQGIKTVNVDGKDQPLTVDGRMGKVTVEAMRKFFHDQGAKDNQIPTDTTQLLKETADTLNIK
ncbi:hypothetical protein E4Q23_19700 [Candidatus Accumulibacter phosphatis]|jgi:hypothetical protein|uniref:Peptidoglycan-binding protein n=1 Tax=Candidatus Accumulibacter phosphatis TaxID=327160 RepID=A0ABX1U018_9PROT|nr:hypothetical protein [Candidatus Accumulibacter phosphatis]NMQ29790.1 hypothetical protein [Candidatus Accumulibacter phosphatis]